MSKNLVIVESPAKAKTIEKILGKDFKVESCFGHIRDLGKGTAAVDVENNYKTEYIVPDDKKKVVTALKKGVKASETVWLATDEDREGEAISWHLCEVLGLDIDTTNRIVFHEITKPAIEAAVSSPRKVNKDVVNAQQARRVLDRLVGFELSPLLWRKVSNSTRLSAGRVQSVAVRIIVEKEKEIKAHTAEVYYKAIAEFEVKGEDGTMHRFKADLPKRFTTEQEAEEFLTACKASDFSVADLQKKPRKRKPLAPFTTSTLQQDASRRYGFNVSRTMMLAQRLYEAGKITYMRTDSTNLSDTALKAAKDAIIEKYGEKYQETRVYKTKKKDAQEAHEAIRPTYFTEDTAGEDADQKKLYKLIWQRAIASQMSEAQLLNTTVKIGISKSPEQLSARGQIVTFDGFLKVYEESKEDDEKDDKKDDNTLLPAMTIGQELFLQIMQATQKFTNAPARYTEATLVKKMEELGIGRPSTYAPTIGTIQRRDYVNKDERDGVERKYTQFTLENGELKKEELVQMAGAIRNKLCPTDMGILVNDFLVEHFKEILNYEFTAEIEEDFDKIAQGALQWEAMIDEFYKPFKISVTEALENADRVTGERILGNHPKNGKVILARLGKYGPMVQMGSSDDEEKPSYSRIRRPYALSTITLDEAMELFKLPRSLGEFEEKVVKASVGRFGPYVMHNGLFASIKKDSDLDPHTITFDQAVQLIMEKRESDAKKLIKVFDEDENVRIQMGRWGPFIKFEKLNVRIPKDVVAEDLTFEQCMEMIEKAPKKKGKAKAKPKAKAKAKPKAKAKAKPKAKAKAKPKTKAAAAKAKETKEASESGADKSE